MECFLVRHSNGTMQETIHSCLKKKEILSDDQKAKFMKKYTLPFWFDLVKNMHDVNQKCTLPLVFWGLLIEYRGLSLVGRELQHFVGLGLHRRTYDRLKSSLMGNYVDKVQDIVNSRACVIAFDNYNHFYKRSDLRSDRDRQYVLANVTACGIAALPDDCGVPLRLVEPFEDIDFSHLPPTLVALRGFEDRVSVT